MYTNNSSCHKVKETTQETNFFKKAQQKVKSNLQNTSRSKTKQTNK